MAIFVGLASCVKNSKNFENVLTEFGNVMLAIVTRIIIPILPLFVAATFATLAYEGVVLKQFPVLCNVIVIVLIGHYIWLTILYTIGGIVNKCNPMEVLKHHNPPTHSWRNNVISSNSSDSSFSAKKIYCIEKKI